jgi:hypothetical protein
MGAGAHRLGATATESPEHGDRAEFRTLSFDDDASEPVEVTPYVSGGDLPPFRPVSDLSLANFDVVPTPDPRGAAVPATASPAVNAMETRGAATPPPAPLAEPEPVRSTVVKVSRPLVRRRGPRRGHIGARRRPATRRRSSSTSSRGDPDQPGEPPGHRPSSLCGREAL